MRRRCRGIVKRSRRRNRASPGATGVSPGILNPGVTPDPEVNPKGRVYIANHLAWAKKGLGRRQPPLAMLQHRGTPPSYPKTL